MVLPRRPTSTIPPGTPLALDWGAAKCGAEAIVVGGSHALVLAPSKLKPGTVLQVENKLTGEKARFSVVWCGDEDRDGRRKLGLQIVADTPTPGEIDRGHA